MGIVISVSNQKGGVGKTTSTYNISVSLAQMGKRVLQIDFDAQSNLTISSGFNPLDFDKTVVDVLDNDKEIVNSIYEVNGIDGLSILPANPYLAGSELKLMNQMSREKKLSKAINHIKGLYDFILIDNSPALSLLLINSLVASDYILVPCSTSQLSYYALEPLMDTVAGIQEELNGALKVLGIIVTMYDSRTTIDKMVLKELESNYELLGVVKRTVKAKKGISQGLPVVVTEPNSDIALEYKRIADKIIEKVGN